MWKFELNWTSFYQIKWLLKILIQTLIECKQILKEKIFSRQRKFHIRKQEIFNKHTNNLCEYFFKDISYIQIHTIDFLGICTPKLHNYYYLLILYNYKYFWRLNSLTFLWIDLLNFPVAQEECIIGLLNFFGTTSI